MEAEEKAKEEVTWCDKGQPIENADEGEEEPADPEAEGDDEDQGPYVDVNEVENEQEIKIKIENKNKKEENTEELLLDGDFEDQEIDLQPAHRKLCLD